MPSTRTRKGGRSVGRASASPVVEAGSPKTVTPNKRVSSGGKKAAAKKQKKQPHKYFFFAMKGDMEDAFIEGAANAAQHEEDYEDMIMDKKGWVRKNSYIQFKQQHSNPVLNPPSPASKTSKDAAANADKIVGMFNKTNSCDRIELYCRTSSSSSVVVMIFRLLNMYDTDAWVWKPEFMVPVLKTYAEVMDIKDKAVFEFLTNMTFGKASDPDQTDKNKPLVTEYKPPNDPHKTINIDIYRAYSYITIPLDKIKTRTAEEDWILSAGTRVGRGLIDAMNSDTFKATLEKIGMTRRQNYVSKLYLPSQKTNLPKFLSSAVIKTRMERKKLNHHVIQSVSNDMYSILWSNRLNHAKYPPDADAEAMAARGMDFDVEDEANEGEDEAGDESGEEDAEPVEEDGDEEDDENGDSDDNGSSGGRDEDDEGGEDAGEEGGSASTGEDP